MFYSAVVFSMCAFSSFLSADDSSDVIKPPVSSQLIASLTQAPAQEEVEENVLIQDEDSDEELTQNN